MSLHIWYNSCSWNFLFRLVIFTLNEREKKRPCVSFVSEFFAIFGFPADEFIDGPTCSPWRSGTNISNRGSTKWPTLDLWIFGDFRLQYSFAELTIVRRTSWGAKMSTSPSNNYFNTSNNEVSALKKLLENAPIQKNQGERTDILRRVIAGMTLGIDMSPLFTEMIKVVLICSTNIVPVLS